MAGVRRLRPAYRSSMVCTVLRSRRTARLVGTGAVAVAVLTGCGGGGTATVPAAATRPAAPAVPVAAPGTPLSAGLLPADAFGGNATVLPLPVVRLAHLGAMGGDEAHGAPQVVPSECMTALQQVVDQGSALQDSAAQVARAGGVMTLEVLAVPTTPVNALDELAAVVTACGSATVSDDRGNATVHIEQLPGLPAGMAGVSMTVSGTGAAGPWTGTAVAGVAQDGGRVLALAQMAPEGGSVDQASFAGVLRQAYTKQAESLD